MDHAPDHADHELEACGSGGGVWSPPQTPALGWHVGARPARQGGISLREAAIQRAAPGARAAGTARRGSTRCNGSQPESLPATPTHAEDRCLGGAPYPCAAPTSLKARDPRDPFRDPLEKWGKRS